MSLINTGLTGINGNQRALETTGNNITNANTDGYSRQRVDFGTNPSMPTGDGYIGQGVNVADIKRLNDEFVNQQLRSDTTLHAEKSTMSSNLGELDNLVGDESTGLNDSINNFFSSVQSASEDPSSTSLREQVLAEAKNLESRFQSMDSQLKDREKTVNQKIESDIADINSLASGIAELNLAIAEAPGRGQGDEANDLLDARDEKLRELAELVQVSKTDNSDGTVDVRIGKGQELVSGGNAASLGLTGDLETPGRREIVSEGLGGDRVITHEIVGGSLGGNVGFRDEALEPTINGIGRIAVGIAEKFNEQHELGSTLDGLPGGSFFKDVNDPDVAAKRITPSEENAPPDDREARIEITDSSKLDTRSYELEFTGPDDREFAVVDSVTGDRVNSGRLPENTPATISMDGFDIKLEDGSFQSGDSFLIRPSYAGAEDLETEISRGEDLALASPIKSETTSSNQGSGEIDQGEMLDVKDPRTGRPLQSIDDEGELSPPLEVRFISEERYEVLDASDPSDLQPLDPPINNERFVPGSTNDVFNADPGSRRVTTQGDALETIGSGGENGYEGDVFTIRTRDPETGRITTETVDATDEDNMSAKETASLLGNADGVDTTAYTEMRLTDFDGDGDSTVTLTVDGQEVELEMPGGEFSADALKEAIEESDEFDGLGIQAISDGESLRLRSDEGEDISVELNNADGMTVEKLNPYDRSVAADMELNDGDDATVGGVMDVTLADGVRINSDEGNILRQAPNSESAYMGFQFQIDGRPEPGDSFRIETNKDGSSDNRNGEALGKFMSEGVMDGGDRSFSEAYGSVVEDVGSSTRTAQIDEEASKTLKEQSEERWESQSGVNLDEEAGKLVQFQQGYSASAQVVSVARDLFDTLIGAFR